MRTDAGQQSKSGTSYHATINENVAETTKFNLITLYIGRRGDACLISTLPLHPFVVLSYPFSSRRAVK